MRYLQIVGTVLCVLLAWIGWELRQVAEATEYIEVPGTIAVSGSVTVENNSLDPIAVEVHP